jgi:hypothetical protein
MPRGYNDGSLTCKRLPVEKAEMCGNYVTNEAPVSREWGAAENHIPEAEMTRFLPFCFAR